MKMTSWLVAVSMFCHGTDALVAQVLVFTRANVVTMASDTILRDQSVIVRNGLIERVGSAADTPVPKGAILVNARGKYLIPGLADMHVHVETVAFAEAFKTGLNGSIPFEKTLFPYLAVGVTTVRVLSGAPDLLAVRDSIRNGSLMGPRMILSSPMIDGDPPVLPEPFTRAVTTVEGARAAVAGYARDGYDLIKVRDRISADVYRAIIEEAKVVGIEVDGHLPRNAGLDIESALSSGQNGLAHLEVVGYFVPNLTDDLIPRYTRLIKQNGLSVTTTLGVFSNILAQIRNLDSLLRRDEMRYVHPLFRRLFWEPPRNPYQGRYDAKGVDRLEVFQSFLLKLTRNLEDAQVPLLAGTDALNPMLVPGFSLHDELGRLVAAGLTPFEALRTATSNPARYTKGLADGGVIAAGKRADLVLLHRNPLIDIANARSVAGVLVGGTWIPGGDISRRLKDVAATFKRMK